MRKNQLIGTMWVSKKAFDKMILYRVLEKLSSNVLKEKGIA